MTEASVRALKGIRDLSMLEWYVIPLLAIVFYIYTSEMKKAKTSGNWNAVFAGLTVFFRFTSSGPKQFRSMGDAAFRTNTLDRKTVALIIPILKNTALFFL